MSKEYRFMDDVEELSIGISHSMIIDDKSNKYHGKNIYYFEIENIEDATDTSFRLSSTEISSLTKVLQSVLVDELLEVQK